jgi:hypothetical protein
MTVLVRSDTIRADLYFSLISSLSGFFQTPGRLCISHRPGPKSSYVLESLKYFSIYIARIFGSSGIRIFTRRNLGGIFQDSIALVAQKHRPWCRRCSVR